MGVANKIDLLRFFFYDNIDIFERHIDIVRSGKLVARIHTVYIQIIPLGILHISRFLRRVKRPANKIRQFYVNRSPRIQKDFTRLVV